MKRWWGLLSLVFLSMQCTRPIAAFEIAPGNKTAPANVRFINKSRDADRFKWFFGDGSTSTAPHPEHRYVLSGSYRVKLVSSKGKYRSMVENDIHIQAPETCRVLITTSLGEMVAELSDLPPKHRDNFLKLVESGYYDGTLFHRIIPGFMIQGGDPDSKDAPEGKSLGMGGPGYQVDAEITPELVHIKGALSAARMGDQVNPEKKSSGSQFFIVQGAPVTDEMLDQYEAEHGWEYSPEQREMYKKYGGTPFLDGQYTVFGRVVEGLDVIDKIASQSRDVHDRPLKDVKMKIRIVK